jgi:hypothetical protein
VKSAREKSRNMHQRWDEALASAIETVDCWSSLLRDRAVEAFEQLQGDKTLDWEIPSIAEATGFDSGRVTMCSVTVVGVLSKESSAQRDRGVRAGLYGDFDLSRAIDEVDGYGSAGEAGVSEESGFVNWKELEEGRIGRVELEIYVANASQGDRKRGLSPLPKVVIRTTSVRCDDHEQELEENNYRQKSYSDPTEAFNAFSALIRELAVLNPSDMQLLED